MFRLDLMIMTQSSNGNTDCDHAIDIYISDTLYHSPSTVIKTCTCHHVCVRARHLRDCNISCVQDLLKLMTPPQIWGLPKLPLIPLLFEVAIMRRAMKT